MGLTLKNSDRVDFQKVDRKIHVIEAHKLDSIYHGEY